MNAANFIETKYNKPFIIQRADPYVYKDDKLGYLLRHLYRIMTELCCVKVIRLTVCQRQKKLRCGKDMKREL